MTRPFHSRPLSSPWSGTACWVSETARELLSLFEQDRARIERIGRPAAWALRVHQRLQQNPVLAIPAAARELGLTVLTVTKAVTHLEQMGIVAEITGKRRNRRYTYGRYLEY